MGVRTRHFCALMKKNWIVWKRNLFGSVCELVCPIVLMAILAIARLLVTSSVVAATSNMDQGAFMAPLFRANSTDNMTQVMFNYTSKFDAFANASYLNFTNVNPFAKMIPINCFKQQEYQASTIIAYAGDPTYTDAVVAELQKLFFVQNLTIQFLASDPKNKDFLKKLGIDPSNLIQNYVYQRYNSDKEILDFIASGEYMKDMNSPGICFGFQILKNTQDDIDIKLIFNDHSQESEVQGIPAQTKAAYDEFENSYNFGDFNRYTSLGYGFLQNWIANIVMRTRTGNPNGDIAISLLPTKSDAYINDNFSIVISSMLPFFILLIYILPVYRLISAVVSEKETKARESMRMMGLMDSSYWLSWLCYYIIIVTIISGLSVLIIAFSVFPHSDKGYIFLYFWMYGTSLFGFSIFISSFFSRARIAAITGTLLYFGTSFLSNLVHDSSVPQGQKTIASILSTVAVTLGAAVIGEFETSGVGLNATTANMVYQNYRFNSCIIMMAVSFAVFLGIGLYFDNVLPTAFGLRKPFYYCLTPGYWCGRSNRNAKIHQKAVITDPEHSAEQEAFFEAKNMKMENFEPAARDLIKQEHDHKILKITDLRKTFANGFQAVKGLNIKMYTGQIFALLGHNGAGKTTTMSMLTGLVSSSSGQAEVFGTSVFDEMQDVRQFMGVCPQHDVLFDMLTPEEHLDIFCDFKGVDSKLKKEEISKMLKDVDLINHKETVAKNLSGGSRRKLSVAIALIGGSKLVLLDEPTAGMDLSARRKLWNMLKNYKNGRIIILTTHYMDEADILGDRIGIMTGGQLICLGSSLFLKNRFGVGYNLTMVKKSKEPNTKVAGYLQMQLGDVKKLSEVSSEITFQIPTALSYKFKDFFNHFDKELDSLDIRSYGISVTTLEEVFLRVGEGDDNVHYKAKDALQVNSKDFNANDDFSIADIEDVGACTTFFNHVGALFLKRFYIYRRNIKGFITEVLVPVLLVLVGFALSKVQFFTSSASRPLVPTQYPLKQRIMMNTDLVRSSGNSSWDIQPARFAEMLPMGSDAFDVSYVNLSSINTTVLGERAVLRAFDDSVFAAKSLGDEKPYRYGSYLIYEANNNTKQFKVAAFLNLTSQDVTALYPQFIYESILKLATGNPNFKFKVTTTPYPVTENLKRRAATANGIFIVFVVSIGFALIPAGVISFILNEREKNVKHMQLISGMNLWSYWISNFLFDVMKGLIPGAIVIGFIYAFDLKYDWVWIQFLLYPIGVVPFTYVTSFIFTSETVAQTVTIFMHFVFAGIGAIVVFVLRVIDSTYAAGDALWWVFKIIPSYCLTNPIMYASTKSTLIVARPSLIKDSDFDISLIGGDILVMMLHFIFWSFMLLLIEAGAFKCFGKLLFVFKKNRIPVKLDIDMDDDVLEEENRVAEATKDTMKVRVHKFRKVYPGLFRKPVLAVEKTSFGLDYGECFALLGVNGAGKTTTFKSLTCDTEPTQGEITIAGFDAQKEFSKVRRLIGYCPQHDAIFDSVTVEEHLQYYARIKNIPLNMRQRLVEHQIKEMNLEEHRKKPAGTLSGGNKRKLSVAMAILGNPPIILLDEPSAGMDPEARRFMWSIVARISQQRQKSSVILTTHSMEEAEALSTKMGIMIKGGVFRCFGSSQHIKNKFGTGYEIEIKVRKIQSVDITLLAQKYTISEAEEMLDYVKLPEIMKANGIDQFLIDELNVNGLGQDIAKEAEEQSGKVSYRNFLTWLNVQLCGMTIIDGLCQQFPSVEILEHYNDYYKLRVPKGDKTIGFVFGLIEDKKDTYKISEYSVSQTTLEQIFQTFANISLDDKARLKFHSKEGRAQIYTETGIELKRQFSKTKSGKGNSIQSKSGQYD